MQAHWLIHPRGFIKAKWKIYIWYPWKFWENSAKLEQSMKKISQKKSIFPKPPKIMQRIVLCKEKSSYYYPYCMYDDLTLSYFVFTIIHAISATFIHSPQKHRLCDALLAQSLKRLWVISWGRGAWTKYEVTVFTFRDAPFDIRGRGREVFFLKKNIFCCTNQLGKKINVSCPTLENK